MSLDARLQPERISTLLRRCRRSAGLTQSELAERAGLSVHAVSNLERGVSRLPHTDTLVLVANALGLSPEASEALLAARRVALAEKAGQCSVYPLRLGTLPLPLTPLFGREELLGTLRDAVGHGDQRLFTLVGPPGVGKTRLALALAQEAPDIFDRQVAFVSLAALDDHALVLPALVQHLGMALEVDHSPFATLTAAIGSHNLLLVLDNFEHVAPAAAEVAGLLATCPRLCVVATSRSPLRLRGEQRIFVPPLALPSASCDAVEVLRESPAVSFFVSCAQRALTSFTLLPRNAMAVAAICRRLDGLPLAIELTAPQLTLFSPEALLKRIKRGYSLAAPGFGDLPRHQRTLRHTVAWSYALLSADEQCVFRLLAVFAGGASLPAAEAVCHALCPDSGDPAEVIASLLEKSLLVRDTEDHRGDRRVRMLETLRDFAVERLAASEKEKSARRAHACYYAEFIEDAERRRSANWAGWVARCDADLPNLRAALRWAMNEREIELGLRIAGALGTYWYRSGRLKEGMRWLHGLLAFVGDDGSTVVASVRAKALYMAGWLAADQGRARQAETLIDQCVSLRRQLDDAGSLAEALHRLGAVALQGGDCERAHALFAESLTLKRQAGMTIADQLETLNGLTSAAFERGDDACADALLREGLELVHSLGEVHWSILFLLKRSRIARLHEDTARATSLYDESLRLARDFGQGAASPLTLLNLAYVAHERGELAVARDLCQRSLAGYRAMRHEDGAAFASLILARITADQGDDACARAHLAEAVAAYESLSMLHAQAACLETAAALEARRMPECAAVLCGSATALRRAIGTPPTRMDRAAHERTLALLRDGLDDAHFASACRTGEALSRERAIALARSLLSDESAAHPRAEAAQQPPPSATMEGKRR